MGIENKHLAELAKGRTEITTRMICLAELLSIEEYCENQKQRSLEKLYGDLSYTHCLGNENNNMYLAQLQAQAKGSMYSGFLGGLGIFGSKCPYCGR
jgi:hypothetical protein